jgi:phospholipid/cholesterol/gamma-HCH transport system permease protein
MAATAGWLVSAEREGALVLSIGGAWNAASIAPLDRDLARVEPAARPVTLDLGALETLDTAGAWLLHRTMRRLRQDGVETRLEGVKPDHAILLEQVAANDRPAEAPPEKGNAFAEMVRHLGAGTVDAGREAHALISFLGLVVATLGHVALRPARLRFTSLVHHMEQVGLNAIPIVGLLSFLIGVVLAYQGATQLQRFGAEVFVVNLIGISVLRELGVLLTAIIVAGRSGSAFTAQIGSMKVNEEVDAMRTLGLDPVEVLVLPRLLALVLTLPFLAFFADMMGLLGGGLMSWVVLDISPALFLERLNESVGMWTFWVGIIKAPVFAFLIALVGCFEGMRVVGSAESVGRLTTRSVVESIFLVIVVDAAFSVFFATVEI